MASCSEPFLSSEKSQSQSYKNSPGSSAAFPQKVTSCNLSQIPQDCSIPLPSPPLFAVSHLPSTPGNELNKDQEGFAWRIQGSITRLKDRCQRAMKSLSSWGMNHELEEAEQLCSCEEAENMLSISGEEGNLLIPENQQNTMEGVQLRPKPTGVYSKEWTRRLTDYQFLSGNDEEIPKRSTQFSTRAKRKNRRATVMVPQGTRRPSDPVCCCFFSLS